MLWEYDGHLIWACRPVIVQLETYQISSDITRYNGENPGQVMCFLRFSVDFTR